jgi:hypothetical protein
MAELYIYQCRNGNEVTTTKAHENGIGAKPSTLSVEEVRGRWIDARNLTYPIAKTANPDKDGGKWVIKYPKGATELDKAWEQIKSGIKEGALFEAKVSPKDEQHSEQVICVYTPHCEDKKTIKKTFELLIKDYRIPVEKIIGYKTNAATQANQETYLYTPTSIQLITNNRYTQYSSKSSQSDRASETTRLVEETSNTCCVIS